MARRIKLKNAEETEGSLSFDSSSPTSEPAHNEDSEKIKKPVPTRKTTEAHSSDEDNFNHENSERPSKKPMPSRKTTEAHSSDENNDNHENSERAPKKPVPSRKTTEAHSSDENNDNHENSERAPKKPMPSRKNTEAHSSDENSERSPKRYSSSNENSERPPKRYSSDERNENNENSERSESRYPHNPKSRPPQRNNYNNNGNNKYKNQRGPQRPKIEEYSEDDYPSVDIDFEQYGKYLFSIYEHSHDPKKVIEQLFSEDNKFLFINQLKQLSITELLMVAAHLKLENCEGMHTQELVYSILRKHAEDEGIIYGGGTLQLIDGGFGFLRSPRYSYLPSSDDIYVSPSQISLFRLRSGDVLQGQIRPPHRTEEEKFFAMLRVESINEKSAEVSRKRTLFSNLTPIFPLEKIILECNPTNTGMRMLDIFAPIGKGQRALIVSPPKVGKTSLLKDIANSITTNHPEIKLIVFLVDERPEEVTDMQRSVKAEVVSSTFDEPAQKHVSVAQMVLEKSRRLVESGHDVVILLDSITRLARAYNQVEPSTGKVLSGGIDSGALHKPKKFLGAARNIEEGGSLTIIATALVDTGSKMDDVIFEEFKGTGNMEINLDRNLANQRTFPAFDLKVSGTRKEELLLDALTLERSQMLRKVFANMTNEEIIGKINQSMKRFPTNAEFLNNLQMLGRL